MAYTQEQADRLKALSKELDKAHKNVEKAEKAYNEAQETYESLLKELQDTVAAIKSGADSEQTA